jgi:hypothetical protein
MPVAAERFFEDRFGTTVVLRLHVPEYDGAYWKCAYTIAVGAEEPKESYGAGQDSLQALLIAVGKAKAYLSFSKALRGRDVRWHDEEGLDLDIL